jgi:hypothetical protein
MYYLFRFHNKWPSDYHNLKPGEKMIVRAFIHYELTQKCEENKVGEDL